MNEHRCGYELHFPPCLLISFILLFTIVKLHPVASQTKSFAILDTFSPAQHSGEAYADSMHVLREKFIRLKKFDNIKELNRYVDNLAKYKFENTAALRKAYARHAGAQNKYFNNLFKAEKYYLKAHSVLTKEQIMNDDWVWYIENTLAAINNQLGDLDKSLYFYEIAEESLLHQGNKNICRLLSNKGILYSSQLQFDKARNFYLKGLSLAKEYNFPLGDAMNRINLNSIVISESRYTEARAHLDTIKQLWNHGRVKIKTQSQYMGQLASIAKLQGDFTKAISYYNEQLDHLDLIYSTPYRREYAKVYVNLAKAHLATNNFHNTRQSIKKGLHCLLPNNKELFIDKKDLYAENTFMDLYCVLARLYAKKHKESSIRAHLDSAMLAYDFAFSINDLILNQYHTDKSKYVVAYTNKLEYDGLMDVIWKYEQSYNPIPTDKLVHYLQNAKSLIFDNALSRRLHYENLSLAEKTRYNNIQLHLSKLTVDMSLSTSERINLKLHYFTELDSLTAQESTELILCQSPYINYIVSDSFVYAVENFTDRPKLHKLCAHQKLLQAQQKLLNLISSNSDIIKTEQLAHELYTYLLAPLGQLPSDFSIIPDEFLHQLPFEALKNNQNEWIITNHTIEYRNSLNTLPRSTPAYKTAFCLTPEYKQDNHLIADNRNDIYPLNYAHFEAKTIAEHFHTKTIHRTIKNEQLPGIFVNNDIFHYSGHAQANDLHGELILDTRGNTIHGSELAGYPSNLSLAVLSACETGVGKVKYGEGSMSLARSFLSNGTANVINSLWVVNDQATSILFNKFYKHLKQSSNPTISLRQAKLELINQTDSELSHPFYWASFVLTTSADSLSSTHVPWTSMLLALFLVPIIIYSHSRLKSKL